MIYPVNYISISQGFHQGKSIDCGWWKEKYKFRFLADGFSIEEIEKFIEEIKNKNYYNNLLKAKTWENSYECNLLEGKNN